MTAILRWAYVLELWLATIKVDRIASSNFLTPFPDLSATVSDSFTQNVLCASRPDTFVIKGYLDK